MRRRAFAVGIWVACALGTGAFVLPRAVSAQTVPGQELAKRSFEEGVDLEKKGDYVGALKKLREAEQIKPTAGVRFHKAYCLEMIGKLAAALEEYEAAEKLARESSKTEVLNAVKTRMDPLRNRVPQLSLRLMTTAKDAEVTIDGAPIAAVLLEGRSFRIDPGDHAVNARAAGYQPYSRRVTIPEGGTTNLDILLERPGPPPAASPASAAAARPAASEGSDTTTTDPPREPTKTRSKVLPIVTTAGAVVFLTGGVVSFVLAGNAQSDARESCPSKTSCDTEQTNVRTLDALALGAGAAGVALGALSVILWTSHLSSSSTGQARTTRIGLGPSGFVVTGGF